MGGEGSRAIGWCCSWWYQSWWSESSKCLSMHIVFNFATSSRPLPRQSSELDTCTINLWSISFETRPASLMTQRHLPSLSQWVLCLADCYYLERGFCFKSRQLPSTTSGRIWLSRKQACGILAHLWGTQLGQEKEPLLGYRRGSCLSSVCWSWA